MVWGGGCTIKAEDRISPKVRSCEAACLGFARPASIVGCPFLPLTTASLLLFQRARRFIPSFSAEQFTWTSLSVGGRRDSSYARVLEKTRRFWEVFVWRREIEVGGSRCRLRVAIAREFQLELDVFDQVACARATLHSLAVAGAISPSPQTHPEYPFNHQISHTHIAWLADTPYSYLHEQEKRCGYKHCI